MQEREGVQGDNSGPQWASALDGIVIPKRHTIQQSSQQFFSVRIVVELNFTICVCLVLLEVCLSTRGMFRTYTEKMR